MTAHGRVSTDEAMKVGEQIGIDWASARFDGEVDLEHGARDSATDVTGDNPIVTGTLVLAHLNEFPDYYTRLKRTEDEAEREWQQRRHSEAGR